MTDYTLYYAPDNASLIVRLVLNEIGLAYETQLVDRSQNAQASKEYLSLNPNGLIPTLVTPDGPIFETAAILLYLADRHGRMAPKPNDPARAAFLKWFFFMSNTVHTSLRMLFYPEKYVGAGDTKALHDTVSRALIGHLQKIDAAWPFVPSSGPCVFEYYIATLLRWCALYPKGGTEWFNLRDYPALRMVCAGLEKRPAVHAACAAEGLGPTPFTAPTYANPPEGSAT